MITANVPSAKKLIVHGPDLSSIPSRMPINEVTINNMATQIVINVKKNICN